MPVIFIQQYDYQLNISFRGDKSFRSFLHFPQLSAIKSPLPPIIPVHIVRGQDIEFCNHIPSEKCLLEAIIEKFGADERFYTCSADNLTAQGLIEFLKEHGKLKPVGEGFTVDTKMVLQRDKPIRFEREWDFKGRSHRLCHRQTCGRPPRRRPCRQECVGAIRQRGDCEARPHGLPD